MNVSSEMDKFARKLESYLDEILPKEEHFPREFHRAIRYSLFVGGKRLRPFLLEAVYSLFRKESERVLPFAAALEMVHTYSLIHDDLPCMDNDALRRGKPTNHMVFGEAKAMLAGDSLLTYAFELMASRSDFEPSVTLEAITLLAGAAGFRGMAGGQFVDIDSEGKEMTQPLLEYIHTHKTGEMIRAACLMGALLASAPDKEKEAVNEYGKWLGLAFQIRDDILDCTGTAHQLGKSPGKDKKSGKATYPALFGLETSLHLAEEATSKALNALDGLGKTKKEVLEEVALFLCSRET
ncbi:MAG TPA: polyprenyl synthetase family protein [Candidatus Mcinerneyibacteriales bacterium]|nr:polyprenyl synthetase family protein [Candidatus Mcinerneyibacteriales bacterium]